MWSAEATVSSDARYVTFNSRLQLAAMNGPMIDLPAEGNKDQIVQFPQVSTTRMNTTVSLPDRGWLLLVGDTLRGPIPGEHDEDGKETKTDPADESTTRRVVFLVRPTILLPHDHDAQLFPGLNEPKGEPAEEPKE